jgi:hypothetical protein
MPTDPKNPFTPENIERIRDAGMALAMQSADLCDKDPRAALMALTLATGHIGAVVCKMSYEDLVQLISDHYEFVLLQEAQRELSGEPEPVFMMRKPEFKV